MGEPRLMRAFSHYALALLTQAVLTAVLIAAAMLLVAKFGGAEGPALRTLSLAALGIGAAVLVGLSANGVILARRWSAPQRALADESQAVAQGQIDCAFVEQGPRESRQTMRNLGRISRAFDRLETARRTWLVAVSEELRRPIHALEGDIDAMLARRQIPDPGEIDALGQRIHRLGELAEDLHAVALADLGRLPVSFGEVDPTALIHNALWNNRKRAAAAQVRLEPGQLPSTSLVRWDGARIEQLFTALIENSLRYTPAGGRIVLSMEGQRNAWRLIVDDSAPGVDVALAQRLFEPFYRAAFEPGSSVTNSGLGLATAQAIVEAHHGRIEAGNSPLGGLRIVTTLPTAPPAA